MKFTALVLGLAAGTTKAGCPFLVGKNATD
jgi:hypothetical protein